MRGVDEMDAVDVVIAGGALKRDIQTLNSPILGVMGTSQDADAAQITSTINYWNNWGWLTQVRWFTGHRVYTDPSLIWAVSGAKTGSIDPAIDMIAHQLPLALASKANIIPVMGGTNDLPTIPLATIIANLDYIYTALNGAGKLVIALPVIPRGAGSAFTANVRKSHAELNRWIAERARKSGGKIFFANPTPDLLDFSTGSAKAGVLIDDVHTGTLGAARLARSVADVINTLFPPRSYGLEFSYDAYDATYAPHGNLASNGLLTGTSGALANGVTGTAPDGWTITRTSSGATMSVAATNDDHPTLTGLKRASLTLGGTGDGSQVLIQQTLTAGNFSAGDRVYASCSWGLDAAPSGISTAGISFSVVDPVLGTVTAKDGNQQSAKGGMDALTGEWVLMTPDLIIPAGFTTPRVTISVLAPSGGSAVATVMKLSRCGVFKRSVNPLA